MRSAILFVALLVFIPCAVGQTATLAINSAALNIDPTSTDSYTLQGAFTSLDFTSAQSVTLQVGPFSSTLPIAAFTSPSPGVLNYQDSTGQSPYWISSLTIDTNAGTFTAQATGVVLSGIENPFMVQLGTDTASGCSMARVQQTDAGGYQLNPGDGANEPCQIAQVTTATPTIPVAVSTNVLFQLNVFEGADFDPSTLQIFRVDGNAQPSGAPLCSLSDNGDGTYGCTVTFNEAAPTTIPLLAQASAGAQTILSPGFSVMVAPPFTADNEQEVADIQNALSQAPQNWVQYGDTAYARVLTMQALRSAMEPEPGLTGQPVELCPDGLSIGIRTSSGFMMMLLLNDLSDVVGTQPTSSAALRPRLRKTRVLARRPGSSTHARGVTPKAVNADGSPALICGAPQRDIVYNSSVLIWDPGSVFFGSADYGAPAITSKIGESKCPNFNIRQLPGPQADVNSFYEFPDYGTIVLDSHGGVDPNHRGAIMTGQVISTGLAAFFSDSSFSPTGDLAGICTFLGTNVSILGYQLGYQYVGAGCFLSVYASFVTRATTGLGNSIIFAGICDGAVGNLDLAQAFTPPGSNNAYYAFQGLSNTGDEAYLGPAIFNALIHQHTNTATAWHLAPPPTRGAPLIQFGDPNLAYLGNPKLFSPEGLDLAFALGPGGSANLRAQIDGASSCDLIMNYHWINSAGAGHLTPDDSSSGQDNFTSLDPQTIYKAFPGGMGVDAVVVDFLPDVNDPPAARACTTGDVNTGLVLSFEFKAHGEWEEDYDNGGSETAQLDWDGFWDVPINPLGGLLPLTQALPQTTVTGNTEAMGLAVNCSGPPVINTNHGNGPTPLPLSPYLGGAAIDPSTSVQSMLVETFGGYDYHLCDGGLPTVGSYGPPEPGYPTWDTPAGYMKFNLNLNDWINQPDHSITMSLPDLSLDTMPGDLSFGTGFTEVTGATLTITSKTVVTPPANPSSISKPVR